MNKIANNDLQDQHQFFMGKAIDLAKKAYDHAEVPVGAVLVQEGKVIVGEGWNQPISSCDPTAHAEVVAIRAACQNIGNYRLPGVTLYVTVEPCAMCAGAIIHGRISQLVFGALEPKSGVVKSQDSFFERGFLNHKVSCVSGVMAHEAAELMQRFFQARR